MVTRTYPQGHNSALSLPSKTKASTIIPGHQFWKTAIGNLEKNWPAEIIYWLLIIGFDAV